MSINNKPRFRQIVAGMVNLTVLKVVLLYLGIGSVQAADDVSGGSICLDPI